MKYQYWSDEFTRYHFEMFLTKSDIKYTVYYNGCNPSLYEVDADESTRLLIELACKCQKYSDDERVHVLQIDYVV